MTFCSAAKPRCGWNAWRILKRSVRNVPAPARDPPAGLPRGPEHATAHNFGRLVNLKIYVLVAQGTIENASLTPLTQPHHRHHGTGNPVRALMLTAERGGGQHLIARVRMHVV